MLFNKNLTKTKNFLAIETIMLKLNDSMFKFIPLNQHGISLIKNTNNGAHMFVCGTDTYNALCGYEPYPLKNKTLAIKNILEFLQYVDQLMTDNTTVIIPSKEISKVFTGQQYRAYIDILAELEIITRVPYGDGKFFEQGKRYCQYRIHNRYRLDTPGLVITDNFSAKKLSTDAKYPAKFEKAIRYTECDFVGAIKDEYDYYLNTGMNDNKLRKRLSRLLSLNKERSIKKGVKVNRVYTSFSNLSKVSRAHLHINGQQYHCIDIKNCQPLLLCYLLRSLGLEMDGNYLADCENAEIYYRFITKKKYPDKDSVKKPLYSAIYFDFKPHKKIAQKFKKLYPLTYNSIELLHSCDITMASKLQNLEASIFNCIVPKKSKYYFTLFDAIYFTHAADIADLKKQVEEKFAIYGIVPQIA